MTTVAMTAHPQARRSTRDDARLDRWLTVGVILLATLLATVFTQARLDMEKLGEEPKVGIHVARGEGFRTPLDLSPTAEVTAWVPPLYPLLSGAVFRTFGVETRASYRALIEVNAISYGLMVGGAFVIGRMLMGRGVGLLGAVLIMADPLFLLMVHRIWHTYLAQAALAWLVVAALRTQRAGPTAWRLAGIGAGLGLLVQLNGSFVLIAPILVWLAVRDVPVRRWVPLSAISGAAFVLLIVPWTVRNYVDFHQLMYIRRGAELEMYLGNRPGSNGWQDLREHPSVYRPEHDVMLAMGEANYFALCKRKFTDNYHRDPAAFWRLTARRTVQVVIGQPADWQISLNRLGRWVSVARFTGDVTVFALGAAGLVLAWGLGYRTAWMVPLSVASTVPYLISHMNYRFTLHVKVYLLLMAAFLLWAGWRRVRTGAWPRRDAAVHA